jgi:hypothetical protein
MFNFTLSRIKLRIIADSFMILYVKKFECFISDKKIFRSVKNYCFLAFGFVNYSFKILCYPISPITF